MTNKEARTVKIVFLNLFIIFSFNLGQLFHKFNNLKRKINDLLTMRNSKNNQNLGYKL